MGVPAFFRWLSRKYPSVIIECVENKKIDEEMGINIYDDATMSNPNGVEFDNLYLDMNGIIHPCTHPEDKPPPKNEDEMMCAIFDCIDRLFNIVRPRKLLYMAIDGVAPRAKMNQQRSRRFRAAKESVEKLAEIKRIQTELLSKGCHLPPEKISEPHFDSNCITPGTPFMDRLSKCLHYYIHERMNNNPAWKCIKVILSDANVPGEGEHKIMDFIRKQRAQPDHDPNTQHVLCGADADLIMLGLATHEPNFTIIREEFLPNKSKPCEVCEQFGHDMDKCQGLSPVNVGNSKNPTAHISAEVKFIFVRLNVLREYLKKTMEMPNLPFKYDFDRVVDDWVFMCFFVGNDFLPHLPSLEIREGAIDRLIELYKMSVYKTGGYITNSGEVSLDRVQLIMHYLGNAEDQIFKDRQRREQQFKIREKAKKKRELSADFLKPMPPIRRPFFISPIKNYREEAVRVRMGNLSGDLSVSESAKEHSADASKTKSHKRTFFEAELDNDETDYQEKDEVRLWEDGFKDRYYESKFDVGPENLAFRYSVALQYVRGLCWVLKYYYQGCASWNWYFPYHYAPFASDFINISGLSTSFEKHTKPFNPLEQLMGVFPAASSSHVPEPWAQLMDDPKSPIIDFYPDDFKIDLNGKKFAWQGVALLPFVDEKRLFKALKPFYDKLNQEEIQRNQRGDCKLYVTSGNSEFNFFKAHYNKKNIIDTEIPIVVQKIRGSILTAKDNVTLYGSLESPIVSLRNIVNNQVITTRFRDPVYADDFIFLAIRLPNAIEPKDVLAGEQHTNVVIGFNRELPQASLGISAYRMLNRYTSSPTTSTFRHNSSRNNESYSNRNNDHNSYGYHYNKVLPASSAPGGNDSHGHNVSYKRQRTGEFQQFNRSESINFEKRYNKRNQRNYEQNPGHYYRYSNRNNDHNSYGYHYNKVLPASSAPGGNDSHGHNVSYKRQRTGEFQQFNRSESINFEKRYNKRNQRNYEQNPGHYYRYSNRNNDHNSYGYHYNKVLPASSAPGGNDSHGHNVSYKRQRTGEFQQFNRSESINFEKRYNKRNQRNCEQNPGHYYRRH